MKNLINEAYSRDISVKTRSALDVKRKNGDFVGAFPVFGYLKSRDNKNQLVPDPYAAHIVKDIFRMRLEGISASGIAAELNRLCVPSPLAYKKRHGLPHSSQGFTDSEDCKWSVTTILRILQDETYIGTLVQGKQGTPHFKIKEAERLPASEWVRVPNAHEALVDPQDFQLVQQLRGLDTRTAPKQEKVYLFSGVLICGCCGGRMTRKTNRVGGKEYHYYYCPTGKKKGCEHPVMLKESDLIQCVQDGIRAYINNVASLNEMLSGIDRSLIYQETAKKHAAQISENERQLEQIMEFKARLYENLICGNLSKQEYAFNKKKYSDEAEQLKASIAELKRKLEDALNGGGERDLWINRFLQFQEMEELSRKAVVQLIQSIHVLGKKNLRIKFNYNDEYQEAVAALALTVERKAG